MTGERGTLPNASRSAIDLGDCTLCHPRRAHEDFERCTVDGCDCVRPSIVVKRQELDELDEGAVRALHEVAEAVAAGLTGRVL